MRLQPGDTMTTTVVTKSVNFHVWLFPGVIIHEMAHFLASIFLGSRVTSAKFWDKKQAQIVHEEMPGFKGYLISSAPFLFGSLMRVVLQTSFQQLD